MLSKALLSIFIISLLFTIPSQTFAQEEENEEAAVATEQKEEALLANKRDELYRRMETLTNIPWYYLAAMDRYEKNIHRKKKEQNESAKDRITSITIPPQVWSGAFNPVEDDTNPSAIAIFHGIGRDGNGDGIADRNNDEDVLYSIAEFIAQYGTTESDVKIALWNYYLRNQSVKVISEFATIFYHYNRTYFTGSSFPIPRGYNYTYHNTWGDPRGWGGRRIHEGTDIFAGYGTPVRASRWGIIEIKGWNPYGGWRMGIRDLDNIYHYYAHLSSFNKKLKVGDIVEPGTIIGYVGSSGYGKPGTSGKFPPHLHYGMYRDNGRTEWSFDPYPSLKRWERMEYAKKKKK